ncbi:MAG: class I SAM-dependent methyltransferase, partial [Candidatus Latescibacterota bacterium]
IYAVSRFDADAVGITLSQPQADLARERIRQAGLRHLCHVEVMDYRDFNDLEGFHKIVSVGMFEHVGEKKLPEYFRKAWDLLKPGGVFLNHGIAHELSRHGKGGPSFSNRLAFPDGELIPVSTVLRVAESCGFEVRDVESLREHYHHTLHHWVERLEENREIALRHVDEATYRIWRLYMAGSAHRFKTGSLNVYQTLLVKPNHGVSGLPLTRDDWYAGEFGELKPVRRAARSKKSAPETAAGDLFPKEIRGITA